MPLKRNLCALMPVLVVAGLSSLSLSGQSAYDPQGGEYRIAGELSGDQVNADMALGDSGGYLVWQDNRTDGSGSGIGAVRISNGGTAGFEPFQVNCVATGNQDNPQVVALDNGGFLIVWQGGGLSSGQNIFGRVIGTDGTFVNPSDVRVSGEAGDTKITPTAAALAGGGAVVAWSSYGQDDPGNVVRQRRTLPGIYAQILDSAGGKIGGEFRLNHQIEFGQRSPSLAGLSGGRFIAVWVNERLRGVGESEELEAVDIVGRIYGANPVSALTGEFVVNTATNLCAHPRVVAAGSGFTVVWSERNLGDQEALWDVKARHFATESGQSGLPVVTLNSYTYGDQYRPVIAKAGSEQMVVWSSMGQDGSKEGVHGRFLSLGVPLGEEFRVNTETASKQFFPEVVASGEAAFLVTWSSFVGGAGSVDLIAQRYAVSLPKPPAPIVSALSPYELLVAWPPMAGFDVMEYVLFMDGNATPLVSSEVFQKVGNLNQGSTHAFRLAYRLQDGRLSPLSDSTSGKTWGADMNFDGLPDDWQRAFFGNNSGSWPSALADTDGDGFDNRTEFLAGTNPASALSVLRLNIDGTEQGWRVGWNTTPGLVYRLQSSTDFDNWSDVGGYRFAAGSSDAAFLEVADGMAYYRLVRLR